MVSTLLKSGVLLAALLFAPAAFAHTGHGDVSGFAHGFAHPLGGLDHLLAMVTVGVFAWQLGGRALWLLPASFLVAMAAGGALGIGGLPVPFVETGIALSVVVLGAAVAFGVRAPLAMAMGLAGVFAVFHGYAHGAEMPAGAGGAAYAAGFVAATALLHLAGLGAGAAIGYAGDRLGARTVRAAGGGVALAGVALLTGLI